MAYRPHQRFGNGGANSPSKATPNGDASGSGDLYKQLIDNNDLVRELDDIEAISQQISQHAEVLYQSWKNNQQQQQQQQRPEELNGNRTLPTRNDISRQSTSSLPRNYGSDGTDVHHVPMSKQNGTYDPTPLSPVTQQRREYLRSSSMVEDPKKMSKPLMNSSSGLTSPSYISAASKSATVPKLGRSMSSPAGPSGPSSVRNATTLSDKNDNKDGGDKSGSLELLVTPEVNGNLKDLVNSFVSTDRAKQAARITIANTINNQRRNGIGFRSPSPSSTTLSSPLSSRAVSPLRSPMLAAASSNPGPQTVLNSLNAFSSSPSPSTSSGFSMNPSTSSQPTYGSSGPLSPSASSNSSTTSSIDSQKYFDPTSGVHTKLNPMFRGGSNGNVTKSSVVERGMNGGRELATWSPPSGQKSIQIPVQHVSITSTSNGNKGNLRSPLVLQTLKSPSGNDDSQFPRFSNDMQSMHDAHVENMKQKFEDAKQRMNLMQQRVMTGSPVESLRSRSGLETDPFDDAVDSISNASDDSSSHSSFLFDQFRRRVARSKRETPSAPHPELTPQQRQHIQARTTTPQAQTVGSAGAPMRRFNTGGSVAERVMIFERCPVFGTEAKGGNNEKKKEPNWRANLPETTNNRVSNGLTIVQVYRINLDTTVDYITR